ncbi:MAG: hypothetical protein ACYTXT_22310 [Nostoc sp.]|uniref:hypothetical protein n=1 Tax=unclassified Nostoc TaxID=2593658 RepID=UPI0025E30013|nr:hypothetical protein [Nostoc sp. JL31]MBN3893364.1 hypothetical protein [Nostoc sp. JL31]
MQSSLFPVYDWESPLDSYANVDLEVAALVKTTVNIFAIVIEYKYFQVIPI